MAWPFAHNWTTPYVTTYSFKTDILVSRSGREQRRAIRFEPRRTLQTSVLDQGAKLTRFLWATQASLFNYTDPVDGGLVSVRLPSSVGLEHPSSDTVIAANLTLQVEPGTGPTPTDVPLDLPVYDSRYIAPFNVNWGGGINKSYEFPRQTVDFDAGRIAVTRPIAFGSRSFGVSELRVGAAEVKQLTDFFVASRGRQRDFWTISPFDDFVLLETVSTSIRIDGRVEPDVVDMALCFILLDGSQQYREVVDHGYIGDTTVLTLDSAAPDANLVRRVAQLRLCRFASDDMTVEWVTSTVALIRLQVLSLPYSPPSGILCGPPLTRYDGGYDEIGGDDLDTGYDGIGCNSFNGGYDNG